MGAQNICQDPDVSIMDNLRCPFGVLSERRAVVPLQKWRHMVISFQVAIKRNRTVSTVEDKMFASIGSKQIGEEPAATTKLVWVGQPWHLTSRWMRKVLEPGLGCLLLFTAGSAVFDFCQTRSILNL